MVKNRSYFTIPQAQKAKMNRFTILGVGIDPALLASGGPCSVSVSKMPQCQSDFVSGRYFLARKADMDGAPNQLWWLIDYFLQVRKKG